MNLQFAPRVRVFAHDMVIYDTHVEDAQRLLREGLAVRRGESRRVRALNLITVDIDCSRRKPARGNPHKYTFREELLGSQDCECGGSRDCPQCGGGGKVLMVNAHCHSHKPGVAHPRNWPIFRAALVDCLPASARAEIRGLFSPKRSPNGSPKRQAEVAC